MSLKFSEPDNIQHHSNITVPAKQLAKDYIKLRKLLDTEGFRDSFLMGPSTTRPKFDKTERAIGEIGEDAIDFLKRYETIKILYLGIFYWLLTW